MSLAVGSITVTSVMSQSGTGLAWSLFQALKTVIDAQLAASDAAVASIPLRPDPAKVQAFLRANPLVNGPLVNGYYQTNSWPGSLLEDAQPPADRLSAYNGLATQCTALATGIVPYLTANAVIPASGLNDSTGHACSGSAALT